eukprot:COSAG04_NODE_1337_length_7164_cov_5.346780_4_plen_192_part_00
METRRESIVRSPLVKRVRTSSATGQRKVAKGAQGRGRGRPRGSKNRNGWDAVHRWGCGGPPGNTHAMLHGTGSRRRSASAAFAGSGEQEALLRRAAGYERAVGPEHMRHAIADAFVRVFEAPPPAEWKSTPTEAGDFGCGNNGWIKGTWPGRAFCGGRPQIRPSQYIVFQPFPIDSEGGFVRSGGCLALET